MKFLITGGAGFIGSNFIHHILTTMKDAVVCNFDKITYAGNLENLKDIESNPRYTFMRGDICDSKILDEACAGVDVIINFAAESHVDRSIMDPMAFLRTDIMGTYELLEAVRRNNVARFIHISTDEVYGDLEIGEADEFAPMNPSSPYSAAKAGAELLVRAYVRTYQMPALITHFSNVYGPYQYPEKLIPLFITNLLEGKKVPVYGDGTQIREWIYTEDVCKALVMVIKNGRVGETYNIGSRERITNLEVTKKILASLEKDETWMEKVADRPGHDRRYALNHNKMTKEFGWKPEVSFDEGLRKTFDWYKSNEAWWKKIKSGEYLEYYKKQYVK